MSNNQSKDDPYVDLYEVLQISPNAEPETIHRVYRLLAQRFHPDNNETGEEERFRLIHQAYLTLSDPEERARYDVRHEELRRMRWRAAAESAHAADDFEAELVTRLTVLEVLYIHQRAETGGSGIFILDLEDMTGRPREHLEFTLWYLERKGYVLRGDNSRLSITVQGVDYFEERYRDGMLNRRLRAGDPEDRTGSPPGTADPAFKE